MAQRGVRALQPVHAHALIGAIVSSLWNYYALVVAQDGVTVQQPVVTHADGVTSGGNQFKVNEYGVILGNVGTGGSVDVSACTLCFRHHTSVLESRADVPYCLYLPGAICLEACMQPCRLVQPAAGNG